MVIDVEPGHEQHHARHHYQTTLKALGQAEDSDSFMARGDEHFVMVLAKPSTNQDSDGRQIHSHDRTTRTSCCQTRKSPSSVGVYRTPVEALGLLLNSSEIPLRSTGAVILRCDLPLQYRDHLSSFVSFLEDKANLLPAEC
jgi:hypothetical protein